MSIILERSHFEIHRAAEYFTAKELTAQTGQGSSRFPHVIVKELIDNALDAAECAGVNPQVGVHLAKMEGGGIVMSVADNGGGISPEVVGRMLDFNSRTSDKAAYRGPTRGAQGNALKTIVGIAHVYGGNLTIEAQGVKHTIKVEVTPAGGVKTGHGQEPCDWTTGTRVTVCLPDYPTYFVDRIASDLRQMVLGFNAVNPHAEVKISVFEKDENGDLTSSIELPKTGDFYFTGNKPSFSKFRPDDPTSVHWYCEGDFHALAYLTGTRPAYRSGTL